MGIKRRVFLWGGLALTGGTIFGLKMADNSAVARAGKLVTGPGENAFGVWFKIADDDQITVYSPHVELGQGAHTVLAQMLADELDADWSKVRVEQAPADPAFANTPVISAFADQSISPPKAVLAAVHPVLSFASRQLMFQPTWGSMTVARTGQYGMRVAGAAARAALMEVAAIQLAVPQAELSTSSSRVIHAQSGRSLRYGELAQAAAARSLGKAPTLKTRAQFKLMGKDVKRLDLAGKVTGATQYGIDFSLPEMRVATVMAAPVRGGQLLSVDHAPALAVSGVEKVVELENAVMVVGRGFWQALQGLRALQPKFSDAGHSLISTASIFADHDQRLTQTPTINSSVGDIEAALQASARKLESTFRLPFLHHAPMEPYALTAHLKDGKLQVWGGLQDPLAARAAIAEAAGLELENVSFHSLAIGGGFGRRNVRQAQVIAQVVKLAMQVPYPVKLIWTREEDLQQGCYRPQCSAKLVGGLDALGKVNVIVSDYVENFDVGDTGHTYQIPAFAMRHHEYESNQVFGVWRAVDYTQHGFYIECFFDELAELSGEDPYQFRRKHFREDSREQRVLDAVAKQSRWGTALPAGVGRGIAIVSCHGSVVAQVIEASWPAGGRVKVHKVDCVVDCGTTINPLNARGQVQGGIVMGLSAAIGEAITLESGRVQQSNFADYPILTLADTPAINVEFIESDAPIGGLGEPCLPPTAPALANALFAATGKRFRNLPLHATL
jgi:isoquinoline 1-oxidoreductase subunit beta